MFNECPTKKSSLKQRIKHFLAAFLFSFLSFFVILAPHLPRSLVTAILLYSCETWTLLAGSEKRIKDFETKCLTKLLRVSYLEHKTNDWARRKINSLVGPQEPLLAAVKRRKLAWFGHVTRHNSLSKTILQGTLEGGRRRGRQRKCWMINIKKWTSLPMPELLRKASCRKDWERISAESSLVSPRRPSRSRNWTELNLISPSPLLHFALRLLFSPTTSSSAPTAPAAPPPVVAPTASSSPPWSIL